MIDLTEKQILVTGGAGFLGRRVVAYLQEIGCQNILAPTSDEYDLREQAQVRALVADLAPQVVIHLAAVVGGIGANQVNPGTFYYDNLVMGAMLMEECRKAQVEKFVAVGTICAYPKFTQVPFREDDLWLGYPEETNAPYGLAKKMLLVQAQAYRKQYNFNAIYLMPVNLYGPGDNFADESSHVIPALIKRLLQAAEAGDKEIVLWGDGTPTREFLYVDDCARGIVIATSGYNGAEPVNLGSGFEISIADLADKIAKLTNFRGIMAWDTSKPNGQPRRRLDISRAKEEFGFEAQGKLRSGTYKDSRMVQRLTGANLSSSQETFRQPMEAKLQEKDEDKSSPVALPVEKPLLVIERYSGLAALKLKEVWEYRELITLLAWRDISVRYKQTYAGVLWAAFQPLSMVLIFSVVFRRWAGMPSEGAPYPIFAFVAMLPWQYFSSAMTSSAASLIRSANIVTKVYFPRLIVPIAAVVPPAIDFAIAAIVLVGLMIFYGITPSWHLIFLPLLFLMTVITALGVGIWLAALSVEYRDFTHVIPSFVQFWMFVSPVVYPSSIVSYRWREVYALNPMVGIIEGFRWAFLAVPPPAPFNILMATVIPVILLVSGVIYFQLMERTFADVI